MGVLTETVMSDAATFTPPSREPLRGAKQHVYVGALLGATLAVYANSLRNSFTYDDFLYIVSNQNVIHPSLHGLFEPVPFGNIFRPLTYFTYALNWKLGNVHAFGYHFFNLLLHAAVTLLLYLLLKQFLENVPEAQTLSFVASLLFAVHPVHTEAVASIVGRSELLAAAFLLAAWLFHLADRLLPTLVCLGLATLSKESAIPFLPLVLAGDYLRGKCKPRVVYLWIALVTAAYIAVLWFAGGHQFGTHGVDFLDNPLANLPASWRILNALRVAWRYVGLLVFPAKLSCDYSYQAIRLYADVWHTVPVALVTIAVIGVWFWSLWRRRIAWALAGAIYLAGFAITSNILIPTGTIMGERLAYLPSAGFCLLVALLWLEFAKRASTVAWASLILVLCLLGIRTVIRNRDWRTNFNLFSAAVRVVPGSARVQSNVGAAYLDAGQLELARQHFETALRIYPGFPDAAEYLGLTEARSGHDDLALSQLERALALTGNDNPRYSERAVNLAAMLVKLGKDDQALPVLNDAIARDPRNARAWSNRSVVHYHGGNFENAKADAQTALRLDPGNPQAQAVLNEIRKDANERGH